MGEEAARVPLFEELLERGVRQILKSLDLPTLEEAEILHERLALIERRLARLVAQREKHGASNLA